MADQQTPRRTLLVEDDEALLDAVTLAFREAGEEVLPCTSFSDARQALRDGTFDALLTDVRLGEFNGLQLAVIARDLHPEIRLIVYSGYNDPVLRSEAERLGATYLVKPIPSTQLLHLVRNSSRS